MLEELRQLRLAGMRPTAGDIRCIIHGHLTRMSIWRLRLAWKIEPPPAARLAAVAEAMAELGDPQPLIDRLASGQGVVAALSGVARVGESPSPYLQEDQDEVSF